MKKKEKNILVITRGMMDHPNTGTEVYVRDLVDQLCIDGCQIDVICSADKKSVFTKTKINYLTIPISDKPYLSSLLFMFQIYKYFTESLANKKYDYLITFGVGAVSPLLLFRTKNISKRIYYAIDTMFDEYTSKRMLLNFSQKINYSLKIIFDALACVTANTVFCSSKKTLSTVKNIYQINKRKLKLVYFGIKSDLTKHLNKSPIKPFDILLIATEHKRKGSMFFLKSLKRLKEKTGAKPKSIIIGDQNRELSEYINDNALDVTIVDRMDHRELFNYYQSCKFLAVPSTSEGFCLPVIEAAIVNRPSIVSRAGSLPEIVIDKETGYVVDLDINKFSGKIEKVLFESNWKKLGQKANVFVRQFYIENISQEAIKFMET